MKRMSQMTLEQCAARMTAFLARKPKSGKTRAYLATLPKRAPVTVTADQYAPESVAVARLWTERDRERYAAWEARGKPPSPTLGAVRKDRVRPKASRRSSPPLLLWKIVEAQAGLCVSCNGVMLMHDERDDQLRASIDHVVPKSRGGGGNGNFVAMHRGCNSAKGNRLPTGCELIWLAAVNAHLSQEPNQ